MSETVEAFIALVIDGLGPIFVTTDGLDAWAIAQGFESAHAGLAPPTDLGAGIELRTGLFEDTTSTFTIVDLRNSLADLFGGALADSDLLIDTLEPVDDPAPAALWGKCVGAETIGPAGERRWYSCVPGFAVGMRHLGQAHAWALGRSATPVSDSPRVWPGRRCTVFRVKRQLDGTWQDLAEAKQVWRGTLLGQGDQDSRSWTLRCAGPESWAQGNLGTAVFEAPIPVVPNFSLVEGVEGETIMLGSLDIIGLNQLDADGAPFHVFVAVAIDNTSLIGSTDYDDVVVAVQAFLATLEADAGSGWAFAAGGTLSTLTFVTTKGGDGITIRWDRASEVAGGFDASVANTYTVRLTLEAHEKVWRILGYDPRTQNSERDPVENEDQYGQFSPANDQQTRWTGAFYSADAKAMLAHEEGDFSTLLIDIGGGVLEPDFWHFANFGVGRRWPPIYSGGAATWEMVPGQEFALIDLDPVHLPASGGRPIMADPTDATSPITISGVGEADRQGLLIVEGPYRQRGDGDQAEPPQGYGQQLDKQRKERRTVQVARACWRERADGAVDTDGDYAKLVIYEWLDPRTYGFDWPKITGMWSSWRDPPEDGAPLTVRPLTVFDYQAAGDRIDLVIMRILATTGTWNGWWTDDTFTTPVYGLTPPAAEPEPGANDVPAAVPTDVEYADLGLGVPASLIADASVWAAALEAVGPNLSRVKVGFASAVSARGLFASMLAPAGLSWSLAGGKYGLVDPWSFPSPESAVAVITPSDYGGKPGQPDSARPVQRLREWSPIDVLEVKARVDPITGTYLREFQRRSTDLGAAYRSQTIRQAIDGAHLVDPRLSIAGANWATDLVQRWAVGFAFWARQHFIAELTLHAEVGLDLWPGDPALLTDPWVADPSGGYGVSAASGRVVGRVYNAVAETVALRVLLNVETAWIMYAGAIVVVRYDDDEDELGYRLEALDDWLGMRAASGTRDVEALVEPYYSLEGGDALIEGFAFDGVSWSRGIYGEVSAVGAAVGGSPATTMLELTGPLTGATFLRDQHHVFVLREYADQFAAWVLRWHAPICDETGEVAAEAGKKFRD